MWHSSLTHLDREPPSVAEQPGAGRSGRQLPDGGESPRQSPSVGGDRPQVVVPGGPGIADRPDAGGLGALTGQMMASPPLPIGQTMVCQESRIARTMGAQHCLLARRWRPRYR